MSPSSKASTSKKQLSTFRGAEVMRGLGMKSEELDTFVEERALDNFSAGGALWIVIADNTLEDPESSTEVKGFGTKADAIRFARAQANGNIDYRVLRITEQVLVLGTLNAL